MDKQRKERYAENLENLAKLVRTQIELEELLVEVQVDTSTFITCITPKKKRKPKTKPDRKLNGFEESMEDRDETQRANAIVAAYMATAQDPSDIQGAMDALLEQNLDIHDDALVVALETYEKTVLFKDEPIPRDDI